jgi:hypothetical protein
MGAEIMIIGKLVLTFGLLLGFGVYQVWSLRREERRAAEDMTARSRASEAHAAES